MAISAIDLSPDEVAAFLRSFLDGTCADWDWDDFTTFPIKDAELDGIRLRAANVELPADEEGLKTLYSLLAEADAVCARARS